MQIHHAGSSEVIWEFSRNAVDGSKKKCGEPARLVPACERQRMQGNQDLYEDGGLAWLLWHFLHQCIGWVAQLKDQGILNCMECQAWLSSSTEYARFLGSSYTTGISTYEPDILCCVWLGVSHGKIRVRLLQLSWKNSWIKYLQITSNSIFIKKQA